MLPFTKRPGKDDDVITKEDVEEAAPIPAVNRGPMASVSDEELTNIIPTKALGSAAPSAVAAPLPAAGRPASVPPPARSRPSIPPPSVPPPARASTRPGKFLTDDDDEEGRTAVRGEKKKVVRRAAGSNPPSNANRMGMPTQNQMPTTVSPHAVIKNALESAKAGKRNDIMAPPPADLLEDLADLAATNERDAASTVALKGSGSHPMGVPALALGAGLPNVPHHPDVTGPFAPQHAHMHSPDVTGPFVPQDRGSVRPMYQPSSYPPPALSSRPPMNNNLPAHFAASSMSVPGMAMPSAPSSMPAHFMAHAQAPYSDARIDPPATSVTSQRHKQGGGGGRSSMSWVVALMAFGLFVGVGALAIMNGNAAEATASFVDPSRAAQKAAAAQAAPAADDKVAVPVVQPAAQPTAPPAAAPVETAPAAAQPVAAAPAQPVAAPAQPAAAPAQPEPAAKKETPKASGGYAYRAPKPRAEEPAEKPEKPAPAEKPAKAAAAEKPEKPAKGGKAAGGKGGDDVDSETKKALEALQKSQLESSF